MSIFTPGQFTISERGVKKKSTPLVRIVKMTGDNIRTMSKPVDPSVLGDFVRLVMRDKDLDKATVQKRAQAKGWSIHQSYVSRIVSGSAGHLTVPKLQALAAGLDVSEEELFALVRGVKEPAGFGQSLFFDAFDLYQKLERPNHKSMTQTYMMDLIQILKAAPKKKDDTEPGEPLRKPKVG